MLGKIRKFSDSTGAKFLLGGIIVIFMSFGLSGLRAPKDAIISIDGKDSIFISDLNKSKKHFSILAQGDITDAELTRVSLTKLVGEKLMALELERLGIIISDDVIIDHIKHDKMFQDKSGRFDKDLFKRVLHSNNFKESEYVSKLKHSIGSSVFLDQLRVLDAPEQVAKQLYKYKHQKREIELFIVSSSELDSRISDEELNTYYEVNKVRFYQPELRQLEYIVITPNSFSSSNIIDDYKINQELEELKISSNQEKKEVRKQLVENKLEQKMFESMKDIEDAAASGTSLKDISKKFNLKHVVIPYINQRGFTPKGEASSSVPVSAKFLEEGFILEEGVISEIIKSDNKNEYYMLGVVQVKPKKLKSLDQVKQNIVDEIKAQKLIELNRKRASDIREEFINNKKLNVQHKNKLDVKLITLSRTGMNDNHKTINPRLNEAIFDLTSLGDYTEVFGVSNGEFAFAKLLKIENPSSPSSSELTNARTESAKIIDQALHQSLSKSFGSRYKIKVFQENIPR